MLNTYKLLKQTKLLFVCAICWSFFLTTNAQTVTCPANLDLGLFDCNTIQDVPIQVNSLDDATAIYGIEIAGALTETGVTTIDSDVVFYCESDAREVTREVIVYNDADFNFQYTPGEEVSICTFTISTEPDTTAPEFTAPGDISTTCAMGTEPEITGFPDITPNDGCPDLTFDNVNKSDAPPTQGACAGEKIFVRSWTATDPCGNANDPQTQTITILDETGPEFTVPDDITIPCESDPNDTTLTGDVTDGFDECEDAAVMVQGRIVTDLTMENTPCPGSTTYTKRWGAVDGCGNATTKDQLIIVECPADCSNQDICEGDILADPLPGECECQIVEEQVLGCTDPEADNFNANANCDDNSCEFGVFDLALIKVLASTGPFSPGGDVTFTITVFNQGTIVAQNIEITDYIPAGLILNDANWADQGDGSATTTIAGPLATGSDESVDITFTIPADAAPGSFENFAEISAAEDEDGNPGDDIDSTPDNDPDNDTNVDDVTNNTDGDEDDHDGAIFEIACIDGCTDPTACNFDATATCDDDSCMAVPTCNDDPCVGDITTLSANGCTCDLVEPQVSGCTDSEAINYDPNANCDDGSCVPVIFDLALIKVLASSGPFAPGDDITFTITVFNQGNVAAQNIEITDYSPAGLILNDAAWTDQGDGTATTTIAGPLAPGADESVDITFTIPTDAGPGSFENFAEISSAEDEDGNPGDDIDSTPDNDPDNDTNVDDVTDNTDGDEDDHDGAIFEIACIDGCTDPTACNFDATATCDDDSCMAVPACNDDPCVGDITALSADGCSCDLVEPQVSGCTDSEAINYVPNANCDDGSCVAVIFDLALIKVLASSGPFAPGDDITFTITVFNQGNVAAQNIEITDYSPAGLILNDAAWTDQGDGTATTTIAGPLAPGADESVDITFTIPTDAGPGSFENFAEISSAEDEDGNPGEDIDSTPDNDPTNDNNTDDVTDNTNDDEDDHDGAIFEIACIDGCTNPTACNFNAAATCDDGTCMPIPTCNTDPCIGNITTLSADGCSCDVVTPQVLGCTDPTACNYNADANCEDDSCLPVPECNTNPCWGDITKLEGCDCVVVEPQNLGCNDPLADNYDANANCNDGSCTYPSPCPPKMRVCTAPQTPIEICLPCILSGELDAEITEVDALFDQCEITDLDDENVACFTYTPLPLAESPSEVVVEYCTPRTGQCWTILVIVDIDPNCGDGITPCPQVLNLCTTPTVDFASAAPLNICIDCIEDGSYGAEIVDVESLFFCSIEDLDDSNQACFTYLPVPLMELYSPEQLTVVYCIPGTNDCMSTIVNIDIVDDCSGGVVDPPNPPVCNVNGGTLTGGPFNFCVGDGTPDYATGVSVAGNSGGFSAWVITDDQNNVLGLPGSLSDVDFNGAGSGTCLIWNISYNNVTGLSQGANADNFEGCYDLSNPIMVNRIECTPDIIPVTPATIAGGPFQFCVGDGIPDNVSGITASGGSGSNSAWVITDDQLNILGLPPMPGVVDFDGAGVGTCLIWYISFDDLSGAEVGMNAANLSGNFALSNSITVLRESCAPACAASPATLAGGPFTFCVDDGTADFVSGITVSGGSGTNSAWVITDDQLNILGLPPMPGVVDFDGAGIGTCLIWYVNYDDLSGAEVGLNAADLSGCFALSNSITVEREPCTPACSASPATLSGGPFTFCVDDGTADFVSGITVSGGSGTNSTWVITDDQLNILGLPPMPGVVDFDGAGIGTCLIWYVNFDDIEGAEVGLNAADLSGCFALSNSITVEREPCAPACAVTPSTLSGGPFTFCVGDDTADFVSGITASGGSGSNAAWVITDDQLNILGLPPMPGVVDFDGAGVGTCLIWYVNFDDLSGAEVGLNAADLSGCFALSNSITVLREACAPPPPPVTDCATNLQTCSPAFTQATPDPSVEICIPCIIDGSFDGTIVDVNSLFECGIDDLDDDKPGCFSYKPLPLLQNYSPDIVTVEYCDPANNCNVVQIIVDILEVGCDGGGQAAVDQSGQPVNIVQPINVLEQELLIESQNPSDKTLALDNNPHIFPVPSSGVIYVTVSEEMKGSDIKIYNTNGQLVQVEAINHENEKSSVYIFDIRNFDNGVYYLVAEKGDNIQTSQFIKQ